MLIGKKESKILDSFFLCIVFFRTFVKWITQLKNTFNQNRL